MRRPALFYTIIYSFGLLSAYWAGRISSPFLYIFWAAAAFAAGLCLETGKNRPFLRASKVLLIFLAGSLVMTIASVRLDPGVDEGWSESGTFTVRVVSVRQREGGVYLDCEPAGDRQESAVPGGSGRIRLRSAGEGEGAYDLIGCTIRIRAELELPRSAGNPRCFDYRIYLKARGISLVGKLLKDPGPEDVLRSGGPVSAIRRAIAKARNAFLMRIASEEARAFARGVLFGDTSGMDDEELAEFRGNGTAHILAVSGLHIGALASLLTALRRRMGGRLSAVPCVLVLLIYGEASCWSPSVVRAVSLAVLAISGEFMERPYDSTEAAACVSFCLLAARPYMIFDQGFQMSFLALLSINFLMPYLKGKVGAGPAVMLSVQSVMIPYSAYAFNTFSPMGLLLNIPVIFLAAIYTPLGAAGFFAEMALGRAGWTDPLLRALGAVLAGLGDLIKGLNHFFFTGNKALCRVVSPPLFVMALFFSALFLISSEWGEVFLRERRDPAMRRLFVLILVFLLVSTGIAGRSPFDRADQVFLDVGQGESLHIRCGKGADVLIDGGGSVYRNVGRDTLMPYLLRNGIGNVDLALATHLHTDHYLGLEQLEEEYPVKRMVTEGLAGGRIEIGDEVIIKILWPTPENAGSEDENFSSMVFMIEQKGLRTLITGDLTEEGERALLAMYGGTGELKCHVLKVAHHGSRFSSTDAFLDETDPAVALIGVGKNEYGHPSAEVIRRLEERGIAVYRTDIDGAIGLRVCDGGIEICTVRTGRLEFRPVFV